MKIFAPYAFAPFAYEMIDLGLGYDSIGSAGIGYYHNMPLLLEPGNDVVPDQPKTARD